MPTDSAEKDSLERVIAWTRAIVAALALLASAEQAAPVGAVYVLIAYLVVSVLLLAAENGKPIRKSFWPAVLDIVVALGLVWSKPAWTPFGLLVLFVSYIGAFRWGFGQAMGISASLVLALGLRKWGGGLAHLGTSATLWPAVAILGASAVAAFLARMQSRQAAEQALTSRLSSLLQVEKGLAESVRLVLSELAQAFAAEACLLVFRDSDLDRIFLWRVRAGETGRIEPESLPLNRSDAFLLDDLDVSVGWNALNGGGHGFAWHRRTHRRLTEPPRLPGPSRQSLAARSMLAAVFEFGGQPVGRILALNARRFSPADLLRLERVVERLGPSLENLFRLRHLRARAIEAERSRISMDLHDGVLQTLLSVEIQLGVLRRRIASVSETAAMDIGSLLDTLRGGREELRRMVTDLRPLGVASADLVDLMQGFAERYRSEAAIALDLILDGAGLQVPDRLCRELFQIYRESLFNIKKHAQATHVVVKLWQNETKLYLIIDDNGQGFNFAGRFTSDELDRLRLGPISIKERTRSIGGLLTVESNPGHGARLTIEIPLN